MSKRKKKSGFFEKLKEFWKFIWYDDSLVSYILLLFVAFVFIKFLLFPSLGFVLNNDYPIVAIVSGSMEHKIVDHNICDSDRRVIYVEDKNLNFDQWWNFCGDYYARNFNITKEEFSDFEYRNGLNIGDVMVLYGKDPDDIEVGEVLVFVPGDKVWFASHGPVIHRVVDKWEDSEGDYHFRTKGDHNPDSSSFRNFENDIPEEDVIGVAVLRIPFIGYVKILFNEVIMFLRGLVT